MVLAVATAIPPPWCPCFLLSLLRYELFSTRKPESSLKIKIPCCSPCSKLSNDFPSHLDSTLNAHFPARLSRTCLCLPLGLFSSHSLLAYFTPATLSALVCPTSSFMPLPMQLPQAGMFLAHVLMPFPLSFPNSAQMFLLSEVFPV